MAQKINPDETASQRTLRLFCHLLFSGRKCYLKDLAKTFECSKATIIRMVESIELARVASIETGLDRNTRWYQLKDLPTKSVINFSASELEILSLCRDLLARLLPEELEEKISDAIFKVSTLLKNPSERSYATKIKATRTVWGELESKNFKQHLTSLLIAIDTKTVCEVTLRELEYRFEYENPRTHDFIPVRLIAENDALYMEGWKVKEKGTPEPLHPITIPLYRVIACTPTNRKLDECPALPEYSGAFGLVGFEGFPVKVVFSECFSSYIRERIWSKDQKIVDLPDGDIELSFYASDDYELLRWVLSFGAYAELTEPAKIRKMISEELEWLCYYYQCETGKHEEDE